MLRRLSAVAALALCCTVGSVHALGLGEIQVKSGLSQRFSAVVPFESLSESEAENVRARLARIGQYSDASIERADYLSSLAIEVITDDGRPRIEIRSNEIAREPLLNIMLEVRTTSAGPKILRNYTVFLDPPVQATAPVAETTQSAEFFESQPLPATPVAESASDAAPTAVQDPAPLPDVAMQVETAASAPAGGGEPIGIKPGQHGPVEPGEALWEIASFNAPRGVSQQQAMLAIFEANPGAFADQNINYLRAGVMLDIPDADTMKRVSQASAIARLNELSRPIAESDVALASDTDAAAPATTDEFASDPADLEVADDSSVTSDPSDASLPTSSTETPGDLAAAPDTMTGSDETAMDGESVAGAAGDVGTPDASPAADSETTTSAEDPGELTGDSLATEGPDSADAQPGTSLTEPESQRPSATDGYEPESAGTPATTAAPSSAGSESGGVLSELWIALIAILALIAGLFGIKKFRDAQEARAQREYEEAMAQMQSSGGSPAAAAAAGAVEKDRAAASAGRSTEEDATVMEDDDATRLEQDQEDITTPHPPAAAADVANVVRQGTSDIELGDNDPVAEADFHLAYGLYDEAALMLQQASEREPDRSDIRVKLAETYFAAGNATQFEKVATPLKGELDADDWGKVAIMGRQLCPGVSLFAETGAGDSVDVDLSFDEPAKPAAASADDGLDFRLEELELPDDDGPTIAELEKDSGLDFDLGDFDLDGEDGKEKSTSLSGAGEVKPADFDLAGSDLEAGADDSALDINLDELDADVLDDSSIEDTPADDPGTKLDLARAYVEMGDSQMASGLLDEVEATGDDAQKAEAAKLRLRLSDENS